MPDVYSGLFLPRDKKKGSFYVTIQFLFSCKSEKKSENCEI